MAREINSKCLDCSKGHWAIRQPKPGCYHYRTCPKKRTYYRHIEYYRTKLRQYHRYLKFLGDKCLVCGKKEKLEAHHIEPQIRGGVDSEHNIVTLCVSCHQIVTTYYRRLGYERKLKAT